MADNKTEQNNGTPSSPEKTVLDIFENKWNRQVILYGPPGTSKTYSARKIAKEFLNPKLDSNNKPNPNYDPTYKLDEDKHYKIIQFHPSYNYDDFVRGIKMSIDEHGTPQYDVVNKVFGEFAKTADDEWNSAGGDEKKAPKFVLVIDEINRAPLASVLGELIYGLEYRGQAIDTPYSCNGDSKIVIPENLYIIGTMNTADRSIGSMDYAVRRRFAFVPLYPDWNVVEESWAALDNKSEAPCAYSVLKVIAKVWQKIGNEIPDEKLKSSSEKEGEQPKDNTGYKYEKLSDPRIEFAQDGFVEDDVHIGHTYFLYDPKKINFPDAKTINGYLKYRMDYEIKPILMEYLNDGLLASSVTKENIDELAFDSI